MCEWRCVYTFTACLGKQVSVRSNWHAFQVTWGGPVGCQGTKFSGAHVTQISSLLSVIVSWLSSPPETLSRTSGGDLNSKPFFKFLKSTHF